MRRRMFRNAAVLVLALWPAATMATPRYTAVFLPSNGMTGTYAEGIAENGQIVGYSTSPADAVLWSSTYSAPVVLAASSYLSAKALATDGTVSVGYADTPTGNDAVLWDINGNLTDLSPPGYLATAIYGISNGQEVGVGLTASTPNHAFLWNGDDPNALGPQPGWLFNIHGAPELMVCQQVGYGATTINGQPSGYQALLWSGTAASAENITPTGYAEAQAFGISGNLVAGWGSPGAGKQDALLWNVQMGTCTDLEPTNLTGFFQSGAYAVAGQYEAGYGYTDSGAYHAMVWTGSADSAVDLNDFLPAGDSSIAYGVDTAGDVVGIAGSVKSGDANH